MEICNGTNSSTNSLPSEVRYGYFSVGMVGSVFLLIIIRRTPSLKGSPGLLLFNEQIACVVQQMCFIIDEILSQDWLPLFRKIFYSCVFTTKNVSLLLLLAISVNLYIAVCKSSKYTTLVTKSRCIKVILCSWIFSALTGFSPLFDTNFHQINCKDNFIVVNPAASNVWHVTLFVCEGLGALAANIWFIHKIMIKRQRTQRRFTSLGVPDTRNKERLAAFILSLTVFYSFTFVMMITAFHFNDILISSDQTYILTVPSFINNLYINLRLCFYLVLYKPLWETTKSIICRTRRHRVQPRSAFVITSSPRGGNFEIRGERSSDAVPNLPAIEDSM